MRAMFDKQAASVLARLGGRRGKKLNTGEATTVAAGIAATGIFDKSFWNQELAAAVRGQYGATAAAAMTAIKSDLGEAVNQDMLDSVLDMQNPSVLDFILQRSNQLAGMVNDTTYDQITQAIYDGVQAGDDIPTIADSIQDVFDDANEQRAMTIARTEVISAYNGATELMGQQLPDDVAKGKEWITTMDGREREAHGDADGITAILGQPFEVGGEDLMYPGDPTGSPENTINCRCAVSLIGASDFDQDDDRSLPFNVRELREALWE
jgi:uncharacterized protein with gpF-like domain